MTDTSEKKLEEIIVDSLINESEYIERNFKKYDRELCLDTEILFEFLEKTQPKKLEKYKRIFGELYKNKLCKRLFDRIKLKGVISVLRDGIIDNDIKFKFLYDKPVSVYNPKDLENYNNNIFSVMRQFHYSTQLADNALDLGIFINGIPIITFELKNQLTKQNVQHAIKQYKTTRNSNEELFRLGRCIVHFAVDTDDIYMTTYLRNGKTVFLPFNKGFNNGAGNPPNPNGIKTDYLWKEILSKDSLVNILKNYVQFFEEKDEDTDKITKKLIFPRYHQLNVVKRLLENCKKKGIGKKYLIQHSAGSGKSNSISWLAHQLVGLHDKAGENPVFDSIIVVTDRRILDKQIRDNIKQFDHVEGTVEAITEGSKQLKTALEDGKKIIITTIQKFPYIMSEIGELPAKKFAIIIDEAHSSQSGDVSGKMNIVLHNNSTTEEELDCLEDEDGETYTDEDKIVEIIKGRKLLQNASYFAFTATPKNKTLELFGVNKKEPFDLYSMKQAIEEGFILDVLTNYTTYQTYFTVLKKIEDNPEYDTVKAKKKIRFYVESNKHAIRKKTELMVNHFVEAVIKTNKIKGLAKAIVVTSSRRNAVNYKLAFDEYLKECNLPYKTLVAFSGSIDELTEDKMNNIDKPLPKEFNKSEYKFLIVANKYQTGFDQPLLHTMYVDKKLGGVNAVQTLSRLNRSYTPYKEDTFVLDFVNPTEDIKKAFSLYYEDTILSENTDPNKIFDLQDAIDNFQVYSKSQVKDFSDKIINNASVEQLHAILDIVAVSYRELNEDDQVDFRIKVKSYNRLYPFLAQIVPFTNPYLERLYLFLKHLYNKLGSNNQEDLAKGIIDNIDMDSYKIQLETVGKINIASEGQLKPIPTEMRGNSKETEMDKLSNIIKSFNDRYGNTLFGDEDKVKRTFKQLTEDVIADDEFIKSTENSDRQNAKITFDQVLKRKFQDKITTDFDLYKEFNDNKEFRDDISLKLFELVVQELKNRIA